MTVGKTRVTKIAAADVVSNRRRGGDIRVLLSPKTMGTTSGFMGIVALEPGEYVSEHYHPYSEEFLYVVHGRLAMRISGAIDTDTATDVEVIELGPGDAMVVPIGVRHRLSNPGDEDAMAVFHLSPLAPRPDLGHVDTESPPRPAESTPNVGGGCR